MAEIITMLLLASLVGIGLYGKMLWLALISGIVLFAYITGYREAQPVPEESTLPKVRPIIVKRRYTGPESIYPKVMKMRVNPNWNTKDWWENGLGAFGSAMGLLTTLGRPSRRY